MSVILEKFNKIFFVNTSYYKGAGEVPAPLCIAIKNLIENEIDFFEPKRFNEIKNHALFSDKNLVVGFKCNAFLQICKKLTGEYPANIIDVSVEHRRLANGLNYYEANGAGEVKNYSLQQAIQFHNKKFKIDFGQSFSQDVTTMNFQEPKRLKMVYDECSEGIQLIEKLFLCLKNKFEVNVAIGAGKYLISSADMEYNGIPIDAQLKSLIEKNIFRLTCLYQKKVSEIFPVFRSDGTLNREKLISELTFRGIDISRTKTGVPSLQKDVLEKYSQQCPDLKYFVFLKKLENGKNDLNFLVGKDNRTRFSRSEYGASTGRDNPNYGSIYLKSKYVRNLIKPIEGTAIIHVDYTAQEPGIAAAISKDKQLSEDYNSGQLYSIFAKEIKLIPRDGSSSTHPKEFKVAKKMFNSLMNSAGIDLISSEFGKTRSFAEKAYSVHRGRYVQYWKCVDDIRSYANNYDLLKSPLSWQMHIQKFTKSTTISNFPIQSTGADITRLACILALEHKLKLIGSHHDSIMIEASIGDADKHAELLNGVMIDASKIILNGFSLKMKTKIIRYPDRYKTEDPTSVEIWNFIIDALNPPNSEPKSPQGESTV